MPKLNCKTDKTKKKKKIIHLLVTTLCNRNCKHCCNKQYDLNDIPYVTDEELRDADILCITGGEPFLFSNPCEIAAYYKRKYSNIKEIYVYTNAVELLFYLNNNDIENIDGLNISIKTPSDSDAFHKIVENFKYLTKLKSNRLYVFDDLYADKPEGFEVFHREWQEEFEPSNDSIFRKI